MYLNASRIPPVIVATIIRSTIMEWGPYSFVSSRAVFNRPSLLIPAPKPPASENSGSGLRWDSFSFAEFTGHDYGLGDWVLLIFIIYWESNMLHCHLHIIMQEPTIADMSIKDEHIVVASKTRVSSVCEELSKNPDYAVLVKKGSDIIGVVTARDIFGKMAEGMNATKVKG